MARCLQSSVYSSSLFALDVYRGFWCPKKKRVYLLGDGRRGLFEITITLASSAEDEGEAYQWTGSGQTPTYSLLPEEAVGYGCKFFDMTFPGRSSRWVLRKSTHTFLFPLHWESV